MSSSAGRCSRVLVVVDWDTKDFQSVDENAEFSFKNSVPPLVAVDAVGVVSNVIFPNGGRFSRLEARPASPYRNLVTVLDT